MIKETISSTEMSEMTGISSYQIRKDLAFFGEFGKRGVGYPVKELVHSLKTILGSSRKWDIVIVGAGNLGEALLRYKGFQKRGFYVKAVFDYDESKIGKVICGVKILHVHDLVRFLKKWKIKIAIIAVPADAAQFVVDQLVLGGIQSILNFAPTALKYPDGINLNSIDISIELQRMIYFLNQKIKMD